MNYKDLNNRVTLNTLKVLSSLNSLKDLKALTDPVPPEAFKKISSTNDSKTMALSNKFILSLKYPLIPNPMIFIVMSKVKVNVKNKLRVGNIPASSL